MKKGIIVLIILFFTITLGIIEIINVKKTLITLQDCVMDLNTKYETSQENIVDFYDELGDVKEYWETQEEWLYFLFNHRDLNTITDSLNRLIAYTKNNDYDNAICELSLLKEYSDKTYHIMGFNLNNIL